MIQLCHKLATTLWFESLLDRPRVVKASGGGCWSVFCLTVKYVNTQRAWLSG